MKQVLFIESGVYEGGSFMSLAKHIEALNDVPNPLLYNERGSGFSCT